MKKIAIITLAVILTIFVSAFQSWSGEILTEQEQAWLAQHGTVNVGVFQDYPPFGFIDKKGDAVGISIDYWMLIASKVGFQVKFYPVTFNEQLEGLKSGRFDSLAGIFPLEQRKQYFEFTQSFFTINTYIYVSPPYAQVNGFKDLESLKVGVVKGDSGQVLSETAGLKPIPFSSYEEVIKKLGNGEVDAIVMDELVADYFIRQNNLGDKIKRTGQPVDQGKMTLPLKKGSDVFLAILEKGISSVSRDDMTKIIDKWMKYSK